jgi:hypothetical protein
LVSISDDEFFSCDDEDYIDTAENDISLGIILFQHNALLSAYMHIPFPEQLEWDVWLEKAKQFHWMQKKGILPVKINF